MSHRDAKDHDVLVLHRADDLLNRDVFGRDGKKVGDVEDFVFDLRGEGTSLTHVIVASGGFLGVGATERAVPIGAIWQNDDRLYIGRTSAEFEADEGLPADRSVFFGNVYAVHDLHLHYGLVVAPPGPMPESDPEVVYYSDLVNNGVYDVSGDRIGFATDAWVSLERARVSYVELRATSRSLNRADLRFQIPAASYTDSSSVPGSRFDIDSSDLFAAAEADETELVDRITRGGESILRVSIDGSDERDRAQYSQS